nr:BspA family leucine-rich repeat surface protein [uncultured Fibrobacter sp.]
MSAMFSESQFNGDISNWDVSNVTTWAAAPKAGTCPPMRNGTLSEILPTTAMT